MRLSVRAFGVMIIALLGAVPSAAQVAGIPVSNQGVPRGIGLYGDVAFPNDNAGGGTAYAVTGRAGFGFAGVTAVLSSYKPDGGDSKVSVGATGNLRLLGGPLVPLSVTLQGGVGYYKPGGSVLPGNPDIKQWRFPVGLGFGLTIPNPVVAVKPWLAPRLDIVHVSGGSVAASGDTQTNFGMSGGIELNFLNGFGLHAAYDRVFGDGADPSTFGLGAHYNFRVPGL